MRVRLEERKLENLEMWRVGNLFAAWEIGRRLTPSIKEKNARVPGFKYDLKC